MIHFVFTKSLMELLSISLNFSRASFLITEIFSEHLKIHTYIRYCFYRFFENSTMWHTNQKNGSCEQSEHSQAKVKLNDHHSNWRCKKNLWLYYYSCNIWSRGNLCRLLRAKSLTVGGFYSSINNHTPAHLVFLSWAYPKMSQSRASQICLFLKSFQSYFGIHKVRIEQISPGTVFG